jgi:hypothetical protein
MDLTYRVTRSLGELALGEGTVRRTRSAAGIVWWQFWTWVRRADTGEPFYVSVPVNPHWPFLAVGACGKKTWGLLPVGAGAWAITPSIDVVGDKRPDGSRGPSLWHEVVHLVGVPASEPWTQP